MSETPSLYLNVDEVPNVFVNQSRWKAFTDCNRYYAWREVEGLIPARSISHFEIGKSVHSVMQTAYDKGGTPEGIAEATKLGEAEFRKGMKKGPQLPGDDEEVQAHVDMLNKLIPAYFRHYGAARQWKPLGTELKFCVEVGEGSKVFLVGRIDNLVIYREGLWLVDYKTMKTLNMRDFNKYENDIQLTAYIYGGTKQLSLDARKRGDKPVIIRGAIIDGMVKTLIPQFHREIYTRTIDDLREFETEFVMKAWEIAAKHAIVSNNRAHYDYFTSRMWDLGREKGWKTTFPKNTSMCLSRGKCFYYDLCLKDNETRRLAYVKRDDDYVDEERKKVQKVQA